MYSFPFVGQTLKSKSDRFIALFFKNFPWSSKYISKNQASICMHVNAGVISLGYNELVLLLPKPIVS